MNFCETLNEHLRAVRERDLPALIETLAPGRLTLIMSDGRLVQSTDEFVALHRDWFRSQTWSLGAETVSVTEGSDLGLAVVRLDYRDTPPGREPIHEASYLSLAFQKQGDRWVMVHDQNTPIRPPR
jgi:ketosteroid isomerase-like protein